MNTTIKIAYLTRDKVGGAVELNKLDGAIKLNKVKESIEFNCFDSY